MDFTDLATLRRDYAEKQAFADDVKRLWNTFRPTDSDMYKECHDTLLKTQADALEAKLRYNEAVARSKQTTVEVSPFYGPDNVD